VPGIVRYPVNHLDAVLYQNIVESRSDEGIDREFRQEYTRKIVIMPI